MSVEFAIQTAVLRRSIYKCIARSSKDFFGWNDLRAELVHETMRKDGLVFRLEEQVVCHRGEEVFVNMLDKVSENVRSELLLLLQLYHALEIDSVSKQFYNLHCVSLHVQMVSWQEFLEGKYTLQQLLEHELMEPTKESEEHNLPRVMLEDRVHLKIQETSFLRRVMSRLLVVFDSHFEVVS